MDETRALEPLADMAVSGAFVCLKLIFLQNRYRKWID